MWHVGHVGRVVRQSFVAICDWIFLKQDLRLGSAARTLRAKSSMCLSERNLHMHCSLAGNQLGSSLADQALN